MEAWDFIIILFWVTIILVISIGIYLYINNRKMSKKLEKMQQKLNADRNTIHQMKKSKEERLQKLVEIQNTVDRMIEEDKKT
ncbi:hypothetical protein AYK25_07145 [Thermoplasmatales archaeon SM1-50]|nr:MAG: hypothetical protein AYK25_07145 [Thermoplasmatales archaeon SM1-50]